jgi:LytS/YehU family sensor histidine kinase
MIQIPTLFLQPYVENAVKHGLLHKEGTKKLDIQFEIQSELLRITIDDNGIGRQKSAALNTIKNKHHTSFATNAMEHRIEILNKTKTNKITVQFVDKVNTAHQSIGTTVLIKIPLD